MRTVLNNGDSGLVARNAINANFLQLYRTYAKNAEDYGFLTTASATDNTVALNTALLGGNCKVYINAGTYELNGTVFLDSNTQILCEPGVKFKKTSNYCNVLLNRGSLTKTYNENILIDGLEIVNDGYGGRSSYVFGLHANLGFYYIKYLTIRNFKELDGNSVSLNLGIWLVKWENVILENITLSGLKLGINFGTGHDAIVTNFIAETQDDGGVCASVGYGYTTVDIGDVYNVTYRNCIDRKGTENLLGYFCRLMPGSWTDWVFNNDYWTGDICNNAGHTYACVNDYGFTGVGANAPVHTSGSVTGADGIIWRYVNSDGLTTGNIYNISFDNCISTKNRAFIVADAWSGAVSTTGRPIYPGTEGSSKMYNIKITNGYFKWTHNVGQLFVTYGGGCDDIFFIGNRMEGLYNILSTDSWNDVNYVQYAGVMNITLIGNILKDASRYFTARRDSLAIKLSSSGNLNDSSDTVFFAEHGTTLRWIGHDLTLPLTYRALLTPQIGDVVSDVDGTWIYKAEGWVNLAV